MNQGYGSYNYNGYTRASNPYDNQYSYQNRDYWTEYYSYYDNAHYGTRGYPLNRQTRSRGRRGRINKDHQQYSRSSYSNSNVDSTETIYKNETYSGVATVSNNNNKETWTEGSISLDELSDAETVQLEDRYDEMTDMKDNRCNRSKWKVSHYPRGPLDSKKTYEISVNVSKPDQSKVSENINKPMSGNSQTCMSKSQSKDRTNSNRHMNVEKPFHRQTKAVDKANATDSAATHADIAININRCDEQKQSSVLRDMPLLEDDTNISATYRSKGECKENFRKMPREGNTTHSRNKCSSSNNNDKNYKISKENHKSDSITVHKSDLKEKEKSNKSYSNKVVCEKKESVQNSKIKKDEKLVSTVKKSHQESSGDKCKHGTEPKCVQSTEVTKNQVQVSVENKIDDKVTKSIKKKEDNQLVVVPAKIKVDDKLGKSNNKSSQQDIGKKHKNGAGPTCTQSNQVSNQQQVSATKISEASKSETLFTNEDICKLNTELAKLERDNDMEVEEIMCNKDPQLSNDLGNKPNRRLRARGKSCSLHDRRQSIQDRKDLEFPNLTRSKSLQARDFLCYTPFRITRSMSNNWVLNSGIDDGNIQRTFDVRSDSRPSKAAAIRKRRQTIDPSEIPSKRPSLFSEQTPYVKPPEIEFDYTPRYSDSPIEDVDASKILSDVTVIYNDADSRDPRKKSDTFKININGRELIKYTDYVKENATLLQNNVTKPKVAMPKKIGCRRKSSISSIDQDPDYVPPTKVTVTPRRSLTEDGDEYIPPNKISLQSTQTLVLRSSQINTNGEALAKKCDNVRRLSSSNKYSKCETSEVKENSIHKAKGHSDDANKRPVTNSVASSDSAVDNIVKNGSKECTKRELKAKRRKSTNARIWHYNDVVQSLSFATEFCTPLTTTEPKLCNCSLKIEENALEKAKIMIVESLLHKPEDNPKQKTTLPVRRISVDTSAMPELNNIFEDLANLFCVIKAMKGLQHSSLALFYALSVPCALKNSELTIVNEFHDNRIRHWTNMFHDLCEKLNSEACGAHKFVFHLMVSVNKRDPQMSYGWFLTVLSLIVSINSPSTSKLSTPFVRTLEPLVSALLRKRAQERCAANASLGVPGARSSNSIDQQIGQNGNKAPTTSGQPLISTEQIRTLQSQMKSYTKLVENHKFLMARLSSQKIPLTSTRVTKKSTKQVTLSTQSLRQRQRPLNSNNLSKLKSFVSSAIPSLLSISSTKRKDVHVPVPSTCTSNINTSRQATVISACQNPSYPITIPVNNAVSISATAPAARSQSTKLQPSIENNTTRLEIVNVDLGLQTNSHGTVVPSVVEDLESMQMHDEFVDAEHYLSSNISFNSIKEHRSVSDRPSIHSTGGQRCADSVDLPPRTASNDSGMDSPSQVDCSVYENRICLCGKPAVYLCPCKAVIYCSEACQLVDWEQHRQSYDHQSNSIAFEEM